MKYQRENPIGEQLHEGEPYFLLRAQDQTAPLAIMAYAVTARRLGLTDLANAAAAVAVQFVEWQVANPETIKLPD